MFNGKIFCGHFLRGNCVWWETCVFRRIFYFNFAAEPYFPQMPTKFDRFLIIIMLKMINVNFDKCLFKITILKLIE